MLLETSWKNASLPSEREHVTPYIYKNKKKYKIFNVANSENLSKYRWEVDRVNDLKLVRIIVSKIRKKPILMNDILDLFVREPELVKINQTDNPDEGYLKSLKEDGEFLKSNSQNS